MITNLPTYDEARKAIRGGKDPVAFMHLGILYAQGIGVTQNHILAHYFLKKASNTCIWDMRQVQVILELK